VLDWSDRQCPALYWTIGTESAGSGDVNVSRLKDGRSVKMLTPRGEDMINDETQTQMGEGESDFEKAKPSHLSGDEAKGEGKIKERRDDGWE